MLYPKFLSMSDLFDVHVSSVYDICPASGYIFRRAGQRIVEFSAVGRTTSVLFRCPLLRGSRKYITGFLELFCEYSMVLPGTVILTNFTTFNKSE